MKYIIVILALLTLAGCAGQEARSWQAVNESWAKAEETRVAQIGQTCKDPASCTMAAVMLGQSGGNRGGAIQAPMSWDEKALRWVSAIAPFGAQMYNAHETTKLGIRQSDNSTSLGIAQSHDNLLGTVSHDGLAMQISQEIGKYPVANTTTTTTTTSTDSHNTDNHSTTSPPTVVQIPAGQVCVDVAGVITCH